MAYTKFFILFNTFDLLVLDIITPTVLAECLQITYLLVVLYSSAVCYFWT